MRSRQIIWFLVLAIIVIGIFYTLSFLYQEGRGALPLLIGSEREIEKEITENRSPLILPEGSTISIFAEIPNKPRVLIQAPRETILVSVLNEGKVFALRDTDNDGIADEKFTVIEGLDQPHGIALSCETDNLSVEHICRLYVAETNAVSVYNYDESTYKARDGEKIIDLPFGGNHFTRTLLFKENSLYISIGSTCNVCNEKDTRRATVLKSDAEGRNVDIFAKGLRNAVFLATNPNTDEIWVTEMGRDLLGDDTPPDEINILKEGGDYGWPICYGKNIHDTDFDKNTYIRNPCEAPFTQPSHIDLQAHSSPLGLAFAPKEGWPEEYQNSLFVAYHGSWNRSVPTGYKVVQFILDEEGNYIDRKDFITGWMSEEGEVLGRPADILTTTGGEMYISDDKAGVIYKIQI